MRERAPTVYTLEVNTQSLMTRFVKRPPSYTSPFVKGSLMVAALPLCCRGVPEGDFSSTNARVPQIDETALAH